MTGVKLGDMHKLIPKGEGRGKDRAANGIYFLKQMSLIENNYVITHLCMLQQSTVIIYKADLCR